MMYLGRIIDAKGKNQNPSRLSAIKNIPIPTNMSTLQPLLGLANYYGNFIPNVDVLRAPLDKLLKKIRNGTEVQNFRVLLKK